MPDPNVLVPEECREPEEKILTEEEAAPGADPVSATP